MSALYATKDKIYAVSPTTYGRGNASMVVNFNSDGWLDGGDGSSTNPYIVSETWEG